MNRQPGGRRQPRAQLDVAPAQRRRMQDASGALIDHSGYDHPDALALAGAGVDGMSEQELPDARGKLRDEPPRICARSAG